MHARSFYDFDNPSQRYMAANIDEWVKEFQHITDAIIQNQSHLYIHSGFQRCFANTICFLFLTPCITWSGLTRLFLIPFKCSLSSSKLSRSSDVMIHSAFKTINCKVLLPHLPRGRLSNECIKALKDFIIRFNDLKKDGVYYTKTHYILHDTIMPVLCQHFYGNHTPRGSSTFDVTKLIEYILQESSSSDSDE